MGIGTACGTTSITVNRDHPMSVPRRCALHLRPYGLIHKAKEAYPRSVGSKGPAIAVTAICHGGSPCGGESKRWDKPTLGIRTDGEEVLAVFGNGGSPQTVRLDLGQSVGTILLVRSLTSRRLA